MKTYKYERAGCTQQMIEKKIKRIFCIIVKSGTLRFVFWFDDFELLSRFEVFKWFLLRCLFWVCSAFLIRRIDFCDDEGLKTIIWSSSFDMWDDEVGDSTMISLSRWLIRLPVDWRGEIIEWEDVWSNRWISHSDCIACECSSGDMDASMTLWISSWSESISN